MTKKIIVFIIVIIAIIGGYFGFKSYSDKVVQTEQSAVNDVVYAFITSIYSGDIDIAKTFTAEDFDVYDEVFFDIIPENLVDSFVAILPEDSISITSQTNTTEFEPSISNVFTKFEGTSITQNVVVEFNPEFINVILSFLGVEEQKVSGNLEVEVEKIDGVWKVVGFEYLGL